MRKISASVLSLILIAGCASFSRLGTDKPGSTPVKFRFPVPLDSRTPDASSRRSTGFYAGRKMERKGDGTSGIHSHPPGSGRRANSSWLELARKYPDTFIVRGNAARREMALTFDDAPDPRFTPQILDILRKHNVKATFFVTGSRARNQPDLVRRIVREGHIVANHSYNRTNLSGLRDEMFQAQVMRTNRILSSLTGYQPKLFRPPYGNVSEEQMLWLANQNYIVTNWSADSLDWRNLNEEQVYDNIMKNAAPGAIVLQHAGGGLGDDLSGTIAALPRVIQHLRERQYKLVSLPEMLKVPKGRE